MSEKTYVYPVDIVKAERLRAKAEAFKLHGNDFNVVLPRSTI